MRGRVREVVVYFKFHETRSGGLGAVGVESRPLPLIWPMAYTTACIDVQAVIYYFYNTIKAVRISTLFIPSCKVQ